jgi:hypothetical protein
MSASFCIGQQEGISYECQLAGSVVPQTVDQTLLILRYLEAVSRSNLNPQKNPNFDGLNSSYDNIQPRFQNSMKG